jgi:hypothetical protein
MAVTESSRVVLVTAPATITKNTWAVARFRWVTLTVGTGDSCVVQDGFGNVIWQSLATATAAVTWSEETDFSKEPPVNGLICATLTSGTLYIYLR